MRFRHGYYRHKAFRDVYIEIINPQYKDEKKFKGRVNWWNLGFTGDPWIMRHNDPIEIEAKEFKNWTRIYISDISRLSLDRNK